ncbi:MAG: hypothetical protein B7Z47_05390 [Chthoniobacter sp. 12-60-6]|nr:MAG: hypothetical protein B7Z47_05390 [Chthoniobacter sp. 12-60-6]
MLLAGHQHQSCIDTESHWLACILDPGDRHAKAIVPAIGRIERRQSDCLPGGRAEHDDAVIVTFAKDALGGRFHLVRIFEAITLLNDRRLGTIGDCHIQCRVRRLQVPFQQERRRMQRRADVVETILRTVLGQQVFQRDFHAE